MPDRSWLYLTVFIALFFIIGFFTNFAHSYIFALSEKKLEKDADSDNSSKAKKMKKIAEKRDKLLTALNCMGTFVAVAYGITLSVMLYDYLAYVFYKLFDRSSSFIIMCLFLSAFAILVFGGFLYYLISVEIPERSGFKRAKKESGNYRVYPLIRFSSVIARICTFPFCAVAALFKNGNEDEKFITEDEILQLVDKGEESGGIESVEKELIENIFDFSDVRASDVMTHRTSLSAINIESTTEDILALIDETQYSRFPVYKGDVDNVIGILSVKKFYAKLLKDRNVTLEEVIFKPYLVPMSIRGDVLLEEMQKRKTHIAVVVDEYGGTCGIVTMEDLLEKIVGKIYDETDDPATETEIIKLDENLWKIAGSASLMTVCNELDITIDEEEEIDFDTIGGLVFSCLTVIPEDGSRPVIDAYGLHIEVEMMSERRVEWALISVIRKESSEEEE